MTTMQHRKNYTPFVFLILSFFIPIAASWFLYYNHEHFNLKTTNHGILLNPPLDVRNLWQDKNAKKWQVVYVSKDTCDTDCENVIYTLNQIKKALSKNSERINIKHVMSHTSFSSEQIQRFSKNDFSIQNKVYLVDPAGNLFMYYADTSNPMNILKDLKHVLEVSQIG